MAKNAVTDWSTNDALNTDIGSTNIAEACAPSGINDAIRKVMAQIATYITDALYTILRIGDSAFNLSLSSSNPRITFDSTDYLSYDRTGNSLGVTIGGTACVAITSTTATLTAATTTLVDAQIPKLDFTRTAVGTWHLGYSGTPGDNGFAIRVNALTPALYFDSVNAATFGASATFRPAGLGGVRVNPGDATHSGYFEFLDTGGTSIGYIQQTVGNAIFYTNSASGGHTFQGGTLTAPSFTTTGAVTAASLTSAGIIDGTSPGGTTGGLRSRGVSGGAPAYLQFTSNNAGAEWAHVRATATKLYISVAGVDVFSIDSSGNVRALGTITGSVAP